MSTQELNKEAIIERWEKCNVFHDKAFNDKTSTAYFITIANDLHTLRAISGAKREDLLLVLYSAGYSVPKEAIDMFYEKDV